MTDMEGPMNSKDKMTDMERPKNSEGIALRLLKNQQRDRVLNPKQREIILRKLATRSKRFKSGSRIGFLQRLICNCRGKYCASTRT
ncbi:hypothetical protein Pint_29122 [Pistacia integerrima]|uniref:Uncharacterized protein n=1 Tax=Pistacia integerrima TaxID=434235 RepID=A0ACC0X1X4_9ROSI|nr:hypothetical protein Pint_29122 [Pistacia integerrima]